MFENTNVPRLFLLLNANFRLSFFTVLPIASDKPLTEIMVMNTNLTFILIKYIHSRVTD